MRHSLGSPSSPNNTKSESLCADCIVFRSKFEQNVDATEGHLSAENKITQYVCKAQLKKPYHGK